MKIGINLLCKLGLTEAEAEQLNEHKYTKYVFARDQGGIGYVTPKLSALPDLDSTFARLAAISSQDKNEAPKLEIKPIQPRFFIPSKLKKKDVNSLSNEDLSSIFIQSNSTSEQLDFISNNIESPRKKRHHRHHNQQDEDQNSSNNEQIESPVADNFPSSNQINAQDSSCATEENQNEQSGDNGQKKRRRRHHRNKQNDQVDTEN